MSIAVEIPSPDDLREITEAVASWQREGGPVQVHPGDIGWNSTFGPTQLARELRVWRRNGQIVALAMGSDDTPDTAESLVRMAVVPDLDYDQEVAVRIVSDLSDRACGVLPGVVGQVEARAGKALQDRLIDEGWAQVEPWTPLVRDLSEPIEDIPLHVRVARPQDAEDRVAVQRASFANSTFTIARWHTMRRAPAYEQARCLIGYDDAGAPVAAVTVWSAGEGRPGLLEPLGVHRDHVGKAYGRAISRAAAGALRKMAASSATVCTPATNVPAVRTYASAGYRQLADVCDFRRPG